jgi:sec-independent protein translocase protein TatA
VFNIGPTELIVIMVVALIVFGPKRLPEIGRTLGRSLQEFRRASNDLRRELEQDVTPDPPAGPSPSIPPRSEAPAPETVVEPPVTKEGPTGDAETAGPSAAT